MLRGRRLATVGALLATLLAVVSGPVAASAATPVRVGSKSFTENYVVAEIVAQLVEQTGEAPVERTLGLGGTGIVYGALANGSIDVYPEYTGTISRAILKDPTVTGVEELRRRLRPLGLTITDPLGFDNTYALAVRRETANRLGLRTISDLRGHSTLSAAFDPGFLQRDDGWAGLRRHYGLGLTDVEEIDAAVSFKRGYNPPAGLFDRADPGARAAIREVKAAGLVVGVVSNSNGSARALLDGAGLAAELDFVIDSALVGVEKPDPRIFHLGLAQAGVAAHEAVYIGDLYSIDVLGARAAGLGSILLDPRGFWGPRDCDTARDLGGATALVLATLRKEQA